MNGLERTFTDITNFIINTFGKTNTCLWRPGPG